mmetsp:Transcript_13589/g.20460  ORF Transcript_13589/g.20460 Transcript_13589/m.20460 type:complete len:241 (-) Transcript_13589:630-1352(-)
MMQKGSDLAVRELKTPKSTEKSKKSNCDPPCEPGYNCKDSTCVKKSDKSEKKTRSVSSDSSSGSSDSSSGSSTSSDSTNSSERRSCAARVRSVAMVVTDDEDVKSCARRLRSNTSVTRYLNKHFHPRRIDDFEVVKVGDCSSNKVKNKLKELESNRRSNTRDKVKTVFVVVSKDDFSDDCKRAIRKLPDKIEKDLRCRQIRRMDDDQTDSDDNFVIRVKSESQCTKSKLERKVLNAADLN